MWFEVPTLSYQCQDLLEHLEVSFLGSPERMFIEERDDHFDEILPTLHGEAEHQVLVIVLSPVRNDHSATKTGSEQL